MQGQYQEERKSNRTIWYVLIAVGCGFCLLIGIGITAILAAILVPNFLMARSSGQLAACESNMKNIATGLEMYATDHKGKYPPSLDYLTKPEGTGGSYLKFVPTCPACQKPYIYKNLSTEGKDDFELTCGEENVHKSTGLVGKGYFPVYTPERGLELTKDPTSYFQTQPTSTSNPEGQIVECESNLKNIATALEMYATDNMGSYPPDLDHLLDGQYCYLKRLPTCPACQMSYIYKSQRNPDSFTLTCGGLNAHINTQEVGEGNFPAYTPEKGIELK